MIPGELEEEEARAAQRKSVLKRMFETGRWSDLQIETSAHMFNVHKSVVCPACPFFHAACARDWKESRTGIIPMPEKEHVVRALLAYCYGFFNIGLFENDDEGSDDFGMALPDIQGTPGVQTIVGSVLRHTELAIAADKYGLLDLKKIAEEYATKCIMDNLGHDELGSLICFGIWLYKDDRRTCVGPKFTRAVVAELAASMGEILQGDGTWLQLQECQELMTDVVRYIAQDSDRVNLIDDLEDPEHLADESSED